MLQLRRRLMGAAFALGLLLFTLGPPAPAAAQEPPRETARETVGDPAPTPVPQPWPPTLQVFQDDFEDGATTYAAYTGLGGADVYFANGRLHVVADADTAPGMTGLRMRLPPDGTGVRCSGFQGLQIPDIGAGSMHWTLFGFDPATGGELPLLELFITQQLGSQDDQLSFRYVKDGEGVYAHITTDKTTDDIKEIRWDTRNNGTEVQVEVTFDDDSTASSEWIDPEESTIAGFDIVTDAPEFSADSAGGVEVHGEGDADPTEPAPIDRFASDELTALYPHWLVQAHDADAVVVATVARVEALPADGFQRTRPGRLPVRYFLDEALYGHPGAEQFVVHHDVSAGLRGKDFEPGTRLLLFLQADEEGLRDFGTPTGVVPAGEQNYRAVVSRVDLIHGGGEG